MSSDKSKDAAFSFENIPAKIGGDDKTGKTGQDKDFDFSDIPVLGGKGDKEKKVSFSFDSKKNIKSQPKEQGLSSFEAILKDQPLQSQDKNKDKVYHFHKAEKTFSVIPRTESPRQEPDASQSKWDNIASGNKSGFSPTIPVKGMIVFAIAIVAAAGVFSLFFYLSSALGIQSAGTAKPDRKAEEKARRLAGLEVKLADADAARNESRFSDALKTYQGLMSEGWKAKEPVLLFSMAECHENMSQDDEAVSYYLKSIDAGWNENAQPYVRVSKLLNKKTNYPDSIKYLEKARETFPTDTSIGAHLGESYCLAGKTDMAATEFKKAHKADLSLEMIKLFGSILQKTDEKDQARELYVHGMNKFQDFDCFMAAANLSDKLQDKVSIMTQATVGVGDENSKNKAVMRLAELLMQTGRKDEAAKQLDKISLDQLEPESATAFIKMLVNCGNLTKFAAEYKKATELYPKDFTMHRTVFETLLENGLDKLALDTYGEWWNLKKEDTAGGYLYAKSIGIFAYRSLDAANESPIPIYKKVTEMNPQFFEAFLEMGHLYTMERNWASAENAYSECVRIKPDDRNARNLLALTRERAGKGDEAFDGYEKYLGSLNLPPEEKAVELIELAQKLEKPERAGKYLEALGKSPKHTDEYRVQTMKFKLIYGKPNDNDFADPYPKAGRKFHEYYLLSKGRNSEVLMMTVPPDEFPDFWKLFILWKTDKPGWQVGMDSLIEKDKNGKDASYRIIADVWNGKKSPDEARKLLTKIHPDNEPLFFLMLAEKYRKDKEVTKAKVCYQKAASERQNPMVCLIDFYSQIPIK